MKAHYLGHVVFYVNNLQRALVFYRDLLGFQEVGRIFNGTAAALTSGCTHHEVLLIEAGDAPGPPAMESINPIADKHKNQKPHHQYLIFLS